MVIEPPSSLFVLCERSSNTICIWRSFSPNYHPTLTTHLSVRSMLPVRRPAPHRASCQLCGIQSSKGQPGQTRSISSSWCATLFIMAQPLTAPNHLVDETKHHPSVTTLEAGAFIGSVTPTTLTSVNVWVLLPSLKFC